MRGVLNELRTSGYMIGSRIDLRRYRLLLRKGRLIFHFFILEEVILTNQKDEYPIIRSEIFSEKQQDFFGEDCVSNKIYVRNLPWEYEKSHVWKLFEKYGEIHRISLIADRETGRPKGCCYVEMENADQAISALNGMEIGGRKIKVNYARERTDRQ